MFGLISKLGLKGGGIIGIGLIILFVLVIWIGVTFLTITSINHLFSAEIDHNLLNYLATMWLILILGSKSSNNKSSSS